MQSAVLPFSALHRLCPLAVGGVPVVTVLFVLFALWRLLFCLMCDEGRCLLLFTALAGSAVEFAREAALAR